MDLNLGLLSAIFKSGTPDLVYFGALLFAFVAAYLLGSVNSAIIISRLLYGEDIRTKGSGNAGMTNMLRNYGLKAAGLTLLGDLLKTALAIFITGFLFGFWYAGAISLNGYCYVSGLFAVLGHIFPIFYKFKGGKGVLVTSTMALILSPICFLALLLIFILIVYISRFVSLGSVSVAFLYPIVITGYFGIFALPTPGLITATTVILAIIIIVCHRENLRRISEGRENKISFGKKKENADGKGE